MSLFLAGFIGSLFINTAGPGLLSTSPEQGISLFRGHLLFWRMESSNAVFLRALQRCESWSSALHRRYHYRRVERTYLGSDCKWYSTRIHLLSKCDCRTRISTKETRRLDWMLVRRPFFIIFRLNILEAPSSFKPCIPFPQYARHAVITKLGKVCLTHVKCHIVTVLYS